jgi:hypothetical protein
MTIAVLLAAGGLATAWVLYQRSNGPILTHSDTILLADMRNKSNLPVLSGALQQVLAMNLDGSPYLSVVPRKRVMDLRKTTNPLVEVAEARSVASRIGSRAILQGSVEPVRNGLLVRVEAIDASTWRIACAP